MSTRTEPGRVPRDPQNDYTPELTQQRREFLKQRTGVTLQHVTQSSFDPAMLPGNVEQFIGLAQIPIGIAGPVLMTASTRTGSSTSR